MEEYIISDETLYYLLKNEEYYKLKKYINKELKDNIKTEHEIDILNNILLQVDFIINILLEYDANFHIINSCNLSIIDLSLIETEYENLKTIKNNLLFKKDIFKYNIKITNDILIELDQNRILLNDIKSNIIDLLLISNI